jgi:hypothetical protein
MASAFSSMGRFILYCGRQAMGVSKEEKPFYIVSLQIGMDRSGSVRYAKSYPLTAKAAGFNTNEGTNLPNEH